MGLRCFLCLVLGLSWKLSYGEPTGSYQPPLLLSAAPLPVASSSAQQNSYQPPIARARSVEYRSPLEAPPQTYSVVYTPPETLRSPPAHGGVPFQSNALPTSFHESVSRSDHAKSLPTSYQQHPSAGSIATSYSVHQQPASIERTYIQGSAPSQQTIHKAPASEIHSEKSPLAADRDANKQKEEYVVYYYYYYDNDTASGNNANNNLSLSFDDIPSLESYDQDVAKPGRAEPEKSANALASEKKLDGAPLSSQGRSVSGSVDRSLPDETVIQPLRPVPNVFRYGSNEVPRFPVLPNFVVSQAAPPTETPQPPTVDEPLTTQPTFNGIDLDNELNNHVLDPRPEETSTHSSTTTPVPETTTTTTEEITTTEATTTTERPRRRPPVGGGRRRFNSSPAPRTRSTTTSTAAPSSTTRAAPSGRFQGNRVRSRPAPGGFGRTRTASRLAEEDEISAPDSSSSTQAPPSSSSTTTSSSRSRFTSQSPRRFQSSRSRSQSASSSTTSTTSTTTRTPPRARTTSRPRPNIISNRSRPPRPGFLRPRNPEPETTTAEAETTDAPEESLAETPAREDQEESEAVEENEEEESETEAPPTTTEPNRFSALFKPRNRSNRPRSPLLGNRPPRV